MTTNYKPEYNEQLTEHLAQGLTLESFAEKINESKETLSIWFNTDLEYRKSLKLGNELARKWAENQPFSIALMFYIKNRFPNEYKEIKEIILSKNKVTVNE